MPFVPGKSGNPGGRPKEKPFRDALTLEIKEQEDLRGLRVIARKLLDMAVDGDLQAIKEIADRLDGRSAPSQEEQQALGGVIIQLIKFNDTDYQFAKQLEASPLSGVALALPGEGGQESPSDLAPSSGQG